MQVSLLFKSNDQDLFTPLESVSEWQSWQSWRVHCSPLFSLSLTQSRGGRAKPFPGASAWTTSTRAAAAAAWTAILRKSWLVVSLRLWPCNSNRSVGGSQLQETRKELRRHGCNGSNSSSSLWPLRFARRWRAWQSKQSKASRPAAVQMRLVTVGGGKAKAGLARLAQPFFALPRLRGMHRAER